MTLLAKPLSWHEAARAVCGIVASVIGLLLFVFVLGGRLTQDSYTYPIVLMTLAAQGCLGAGWFLFIRGGES